MSKGQKKRLRKTALGIAAGVAVTAVCPPAGIALATVGFLRGARRYAQTGDPNAAREMVMSYGDLSTGSSNTSRRR